MNQLKRNRLIFFLSPSRLICSTNFIFSYVPWNDLDKNSFRRITNNYIISNWERKNLNILTVWFVAIWVVFGLLLYELCSVCCCMSCVRFVAIWVVFGLLLYELCSVCCCMSCVRFVAVWVVFGLLLYELCSRDTDKQFRCSWLVGFPPQRMHNCRATVECYVAGSRKHREGFIGVNQPWPMTLSCDFFFPNVCNAPLS